MPAYLAARRLQYATSAILRPPIGFKFGLANNRVAFVNGKPAFLKVA